MYYGIKQWNFSCPAVSQICILTILSSTYIVLVRKSIPTVAYIIISVIRVSFNFSLNLNTIFEDAHLLFAVICVLGEAQDYGCLSHGLISEEDYLVLQKHLVI